MSVETAPILTITVPGHPPSLNARLHPMQRYRISRDFKESVAWQCRAFYHGLPLERARLQVTLLYARRGFKDLDNAMACCKPAVDGLVLGRLLVDDSPDHLAWLPVVQAVGTERAIRLEVWRDEEGLL